MGRPLKTQKRGKGSPTWRAPSHRFKTNAKYRSVDKKIKAEIINFEKDPAHSTVLALLKYEDGEENYVLAAEGLIVGGFIEHGEKAELKKGSILALKDIPEGYPIFNIESRVGDGGKLVRSSGSCAYITSTEKGKVLIKLPSKKIKRLNINCKATLGCAACGGRTERPLLKAGNAYYKHRARNKYWPINRGVKMNPVDHPFGGKQHHGAVTKKGKGGSPGHHVGSFGSKRTGRKKR